MRRLRSDSGKAMTAADASNDAKDRGLLCCKKESAFIRALGIGEGLMTLAYKEKNKGGQFQSKTKEQWWAPAELVRMNNALLKRGISGKLRAKAIRCMLEGKPLPERLHGAVADYTEEILGRRAS